MKVGAAKEKSVGRLLGIHTNVGMFSGSWKYKKKFNIMEPSHLVFSTVFMTNYAVIF